MDGFCVCMIADLIGSRSLKNSEKLDRLAADLAALGSGTGAAGKPAGYLVAPSRRAGDELFLLAGEALIAPAFRLLYEAHLSGMPMYVGLGAGWAQDLVHREDAERAEGPMIFRAADALKALKDKPADEVLRSISRDGPKPAAFRYNLYTGPDSAVNRMVTGHLLLLMRIIGQRGDLQRRAVALKRTHPGQPARAYAGELWPDPKERPQDVTKSFSKHLMRAEYALVDEMAADFVKTLKRLTPRGTAP